jgi:hypothetical protein
MVLLGLWSWMSKVDTPDRSMRRRVRGDQLADLDRVQRIVDER